VGGDRLEEGGDGAGFAFGVPGGVGRVAPSAAEVAAAGADEEGGDAGQFALALQGMEDLGNQHPETRSKANPAPEANAELPGPACLQCASSVPTVLLQSAQRAGAAGKRYAESAGEQFGQSVRQFLAQAVHERGGDFGSVSSG
jgi:hypothetical protein